MFALLKIYRNLSLPMDIMLKLFIVLVKPVVVYGAEVWGSEKCDILERLQLRFAIPLDVDIKSRMLTFWQDYVLVINTRSLIRSTLYYIH